MNTTLIQNGLRLAIARLMDNCLETEAEMLYLTVPTLVATCVAQAALHLAWTPDTAFLDAVQLKGYKAIPSIAAGGYFRLHGTLLSEWEWAKKQAAILRELDIKKCHLSIATPSVARFGVCLEAGLFTSTYPLDLEPDERDIAIAAAEVVAIALNYFGFEVETDLPGSRVLPIYFDTPRLQSVTVAPQPGIVTPAMVGSYVENARAWTYETLATIGFVNHPDELVRVTMTHTKTDEPVTPESRRDWQITLFNSTTAYVLEVLKIKRETALDIATAVAIAADQGGFKVDETRLANWIEPGERSLLITYFGIMNDSRNVEEQAA